MKRIYAFLLTVVMLLTVGTLDGTAQVQKGRVRTIGRPNVPGKALAGVAIRARGQMNAVLTDGLGEFQIIIPNKKEGDAWVLQSAQKKGYELKDHELVGRQLVFSSNVPLVILMVDIKQLEADRQRIEENAYRVAERNYQKKLQELEQQKANNELTAERYRQELQALQENYERYQNLIGDMADRYARTDYDQLDSIDREINMCIEQGELDRADSLIHTVFDPETVLQRNRAAKEEVQSRITFAQSVIDKAVADREAILRDMEYAARVATLAEMLAEEYIAQGLREEARNNLQKALEIKTIIHGEESEEVGLLRDKIIGLEYAE